ncbi:MAG: ethanolamine ammonia-lyase subunit EutC [Burkholderiaceae bacterium]
MSESRQAQGGRSRPWRSDDAWRRLRELTPARIALGRAGSGLPTDALLAFQAAHAAARDAVHAAFDPTAIQDALAAIGHPVITVSSQAGDRVRYLQRPDLGRLLNDEDAQRLAEGAGEGCDLVIIIADGLSATATMAHALALTLRLLRHLPAHGVRPGPVIIANQARVALADAIGEQMKAAQSLILLGERPGLSSPDSLSGYLTWQPAPGRRDSQRNCVSNIRPGAGLGYDAAAHTLIYLMLEARRRRLTGVALKDDSATSPSLLQSP